MTKLSKREQQVLEFVANGLGTKQIAAQLGITGHTVNRYRTIIKEKLWAETTPHAIYIACQRGLLTTEQQKEAA